MDNKLGRMTIVRRTGEETFVNADADLGFDLLNFWRWSASARLNRWWVLMSRSQI